MSNKSRVSMSRIFTTAFYRKILCRLWNTQLPNDIICMTLLSSWLVSIVPEEVSSDYPLCFFKRHHEHCMLTHIVTICATAERGSNLLSTLVVPWFKNVIQNISLSKILSSISVRHCPNRKVYGCLCLVSCNSKMEDLQWNIRTPKTRKHCQLMFPGYKFCIFAL